MGLRKDLIRKQYLDLRKKRDSFHCFQFSWEIQRKILTSVDYLNSKVIGLYYPIMNEAHTFRIITRSLMDAKIIGLPVIVNQKLSFREIDCIKNLKLGPYSILEPNNSNRLLSNELNMIIVPGIAFDLLGNRIGYGKGYYDKFLDSINSSELKIVGIGYDFQLLDDCIESNEFDVKLHSLYTEKRILSFK